jgi:hypothetical protein
MPATNPPTTNSPTRDELASRYFDQLPYEPYKVQEEALLAWFSAEQGVLVAWPFPRARRELLELLRSNEAGFVEFLAGYFDMLTQFMPVMERLLEGGNGKGS